MRIRIKWLRKRSRKELNAGLSNSWLSFRSLSFLGRSLTGFLEHKTKPQTFNPQTDDLYPAGAEGKLKRLFKHSTEAKSPDNYMPIAAIKVYHVSLDDTLREAGLKREYYRARQLGRKAFIAKRFGGPEEGGQSLRYYLATEYIPGFDLADSYIEHNKQKLFHNDNISDCLTRFIGLAKQMALFHKKGLVNLDFKPENIRFNSVKKQLELVDLSSVIPVTGFARDEIAYTPTHWRLNKINGSPAFQELTEARDNFSQSDEVYSFFLMLAEFLPEREQYFDFVTAERRLRPSLDGAEFREHLVFYAHTLSAKRDAINALPDTDPKKKLLTLIADVCDPLSTKVIKEIPSMVEALKQLKAIKKAMDKKYVADFRKHYDTKKAYFGGRVGRLIFWDKLCRRQTCKESIEKLAQSKPESATARALDAYKRANQNERNNNR